MYNEKLLRTALTYEAFRGNAETNKIICKFLHEKGLSPTANASSSTVMCFAESEADVPLVIEALNRLGYDIDV